VAGHTFIVELLLQSRTDIVAEHVGDALVCAAIAGHSPVVNAILQRRTDIYAAILISSFKFALISLLIMFFKFVLAQP
jgi:hypothetical protein